MPEIKDESSSTAEPVTPVAVTTESLMEELRRDLSGEIAKPEQGAPPEAAAGQEPSPADTPEGDAPSTDEDEKPDEESQQWPKSALDTVTKLREKGRALKERAAQADELETQVAALTTRSAELATQLEALKSAGPTVVTSKERELEAKIASCEATILKIEASPDGITITDKDGKELSYDQAALARAKIQYTVQAAAATMQLDALREKKVGEAQSFQTQAEATFPFLKDPHSASNIAIKGILTEYPELRSCPKIMAYLGAAFTWATQQNGKSPGPGTQVKAAAPARKVVQVPKLPTGSSSLPTPGAVDIGADFLRKSQAGTATRSDAEKYTLAALAGN